MIIKNTYFDIGCKGTTYFGVSKGNVAAFLTRDTGLRNTGPFIVSRLVVSRSRFNLQRTDKSCRIGILQDDDITLWKELKRVITKHLRSGKLAVSRAER